MDRLAGIGISLAPNQQGQFVITKIAPNGPAFQSKEIELGDVLNQVNGTLLEGMSVDQVWSIITGPPNSRVDLQLFRFKDESAELDEIYVSLFRRSSQTDRSSMASPSTFEGTPTMLLRQNRSAGHLFAAYTPDKALRASASQRTLGRATWSETFSPASFFDQDRRDVSPVRGPGPLFAANSITARSGPVQNNFSPMIMRSTSETDAGTMLNTGNAESKGGIDMYGVLRDPSRISPSKSPPRVPSIDGGGFQTNPQRTRRPISGRASWPGIRTQENQFPFEPTRFASPPPLEETFTSKPALKDFISPEAHPGVYGVGIILQNDLYGDLRIVNLTPGGPAEAQGCPFQPGDIMLTADGRVVRGLPAALARPLFQGAFGSRIEVTVLRPVLARSLGIGISSRSFPISFAIFRGLSNLTRESMLNASDALYDQPSPVEKNLSPEHEAQQGGLCGIGVFIERIMGCLVIKHINPKGAASHVPSSSLYPGDYLVAIDGVSTQHMSLNQVREKIMGVRGTYVTLSLRRFMPTVGAFSHVFETSIMRHRESLDRPRGRRTMSPGAGVTGAPAWSTPSSSYKPSQAAPPAPPQDSGDAAPPTELGGVACGVGMDIRELEGLLIVTRLTPGGPASRSGLIAPGDVLHRIDYQSLAGLALGDVHALLTGPARSSVVLGLLKPKHRLRVNVRLQREPAPAPRPMPPADAWSAAGARPRRAGGAPHARAGPGLGGGWGGGGQAAGGGPDGRSTMQFSAPRAGGAERRGPFYPSPSATVPLMLSPMHTLSRLDYSL